MGMSSRFLSGETPASTGTFNTILEVTGRPGIITNLHNFKTTSTGGSVGSVELRITVDGVSYTMIDKLGIDYAVILKGASWTNSIKIEAKLAGSYTIAYQLAYVVEV